MSVSQAMQRASKNCNAFYGHLGNSLHISRVIEPVVYHSSMLATHPPLIARTFYGVNMRLYRSHRDLHPDLKINLCGYSMSMARQSGEP
jgi:hypothetical protein